MRYFYLCAIFYAPFTAAHSWRDQFEIYKHTIDEAPYQLLLRQYTCFSESAAPFIADDVIKSIPIIESGEPLISIDELAHPRIWALEGERLYLAHDAPEDIDPRGQLHGHVRASVADALVRMIAALDRCAPAFGYDPGELEIALFEGLRDLGTQKELFDTKMAAIMAADPTLSYEEAYRKTSCFVSPYIDNLPTHSTGAAIDICLWSNKKQAFCRMGRFNVGSPAAPTFTHEHLSDDAIRNRLLFVFAAAAAGLTNYLYEFWHFSYGDRYAAYWRSVDPALRSALYGAL